MQKDPDVAVTMETVPDCLSLLCKTGDGLAHTYVRFAAPDRYVKFVFVLSNVVLNRQNFVVNSIL